MLKYTVLFIVLIFSSREGWCRDKFTFKVNDGNLIGDALKLEPFTKINKGYYFFGSERVNWYVAYEKCRELDAELITFETDEEIDEIANYLNSNQERGDYWTSGNDLVMTGTHKWFTNAQRINSLRWARGQPDNFRRREHCIHLGYIFKDSIGFELGDRPCANEDNRSLFQFICETPNPETISIVVWK
ncbi:C-type lectin 37Da-like [Drosophila obscura]|uniref:C-type lectin 37Da-like n=1 Tax=Drosophila obscura TaxID=7282 RepID=UPI001BB27366|nr:C-type lectin 37Da-like [Drosophila obscura]